MTDDIVERSFVELGSVPSFDLLVGAKAGRLHQLLLAGFPVPPGYVITPGLVAGLLDVDATVCADAVLCRHHAVIGDARAAVRSSAFDEDLPHSSQAGRYASVLNVAADELIPRITAIGGQGGPGHHIPVLVQRMVVAVAAGVCFSSGPWGGREDGLVVEYVLGLADQLTDGSREPARTLFIRAGSDAAGEGADTAGDPLMKYVDARIRNTLVGLVAEAAACFGGPQDVEWVLDPDGEVHIVQSRDISRAYVTPNHISNG